ncbi:MAG: photosystem II repair protein Psb32 [Elainellaceae cyanobacterium]
MLHSLHSFLKFSSLRVDGLVRYFVLPLLVAIALIQLWVAPAYATGVYDLPSVSAGESTWVIDEADILSRISKGKISQAFKSLSDETGREVRFVTIHRLDYGETAESLVNKLFETWFPTEDAQANQVVLLLDNVTNNAAIRAGDEVKDVLSDDISESVAQETLMVPLRNGNKYNQALLDAGDRLVAVLSGQPDPGPPVVADTVQAESTFASAEETDTNNATVLVIGFLVAATIIPMATYYAYKLLGG